MYETSSQAVAAVRKLIRGVQNATQISENDLIRIHVILIGHESPIQIIEEALQGLKRQHDQDLRLARSIDEHAETVFKRQMVSVWLERRRGPIWMSTISSREVHGSELSRAQTLLAQELKISTSDVEPKRGYRWKIEPSCLQY